jgi:hypothetical protein
MKSTIGLYFSSGLGKPLRTADTPRHMTWLLRSQEFNARRTRAFSRRARSIDATDSLGTRLLRTEQPGQCSTSLRRCRVSWCCRRNVVSGLDCLGIGFEQRIVGCPKRVHAQPVNNERIARPELCCQRPQTPASMICMKSNVEPEVTESGGFVIAASLGAGLLALGILIGTLLAMSAQSLAKSVIAALFALFGGSLLAFLQKVPIHDQFKASIGVFGISIGCLIGIYSGLYVNEHQLLTPVSNRASTNSKQASASDCDPKYLRANVMSQSNSIDQQYRTNQITGDRAYQELHALVVDRHE